MTAIPTGPQPSLGKEKGFVLVPHPDFPSRAISSISVEAEEGNGSLNLTYHVAGAIDAVLWPLPGAGGHADGLWEHSCFEAFVGRAGEAGYTELNLATSGQWAVYAFDGYRAGMTAIEGPAVALSVSFDPEMVRLSASIDLPILSHGREWELGLSAIIEAKDGTKSYWALSHPPGQPDFHNRDCFTALLAAPKRP
jgi:hypothetical protein